MNQNVGKNLFKIERERERKKEKKTMARREQQIDSWQKTSQQMECFISTRAGLAFDIYTYFFVVVAAVVGSCLSSN